MEKNNIKDIVIFVDRINRRIVKDLKSYDNSLKVFLLRDIKYKVKDGDRFSYVDYLAYIDFTKPLEIAEALLPHSKHLLAITAQSEASVGYFKQVIPHTPYLRTPTQTSIAWSTDKYEMRKRMKLFIPKFTPKFTKIKENTKTERARVISKVGFPMIVKPTNLQESVLVTICYHEDELDKTLRTIFKKLKSEYNKFGRDQLPTILAEEFMEGTIFSVDSYVDSRGTTYHCPLVKVTTGRNIGHDDFYNYLRVTPVKLKRETIESAQQVTDGVIHALGLRSTSTHTELIKMDDEWKVIEVGPRIGGYRQDLHKLSCNINHALNDVLIRIPKKPIIPKKCKGFASVMRFYPPKEGIIKKISGLRNVEKYESVKKVRQKLKVGEKVVFAKNGGTGVVDITLFHFDRSQILADIRRIEKTLKVTVD